MSGIWARSILASEHAVTGARLDTVLCRLPKSLLAELNTHRAFSRNAASSRAIPVAKIIEQVKQDPFVPVKWFKNRPGMQGVEELSAHDAECARERWLIARDSAVHHAERLVGWGAHKQHVNRLLEPWMWALDLISSTKWENFYALRDHSDAEPHMELLAKAVREARAGAPVQVLQPGEWHLPFADGLGALVNQFDPAGLQDAKTLSVARCASTSYKTVDGYDMTMERAQKIYDSLLSAPLHASPFEHVAQADEIVGLDKQTYRHPRDHRNFQGFRQCRALVERERRLAA